MYPSQEVVDIQLHSQELYNFEMLLRLDSNINQILTFIAYSDS